MKVVIFTRENDIDGVSCATLAKLTYGDDCEVVFSSQEKINQDFIDFFDIEERYDEDEEIDSFDITGSKNWTRLWFVSQATQVMVCSWPEIFFRLSRLQWGMISVHSRIIRQISVPRKVR